MKYIVDFKNEVSVSEIEDHIKRLNATIIKTFNLFERTYLVECEEQIVFDDSLHSYVVNDDENLLKLLSTTIVSNQTWGVKQLTGPVIDISTTDIKDWWKNYVIFKPEFEEPSYQIDRKGSGVTVYVLDSGCEISHPEFLNRPVSNLFSFNGDFQDTNGHGTAIASVITGSTCGVTDATVKNVKIFDSRVATKQSDLINALDSIYLDFTQNNLGFAVVNCSWTISKNTFIESKLQSLIDMGVIVVAAAGNDGSPISDVTPASMSSAITIGSFNQSLVPSDFSDYTGSIVNLTTNVTNTGELDGWAPGEQIYSAGLNGTYGMTAGTSMAAGIHSAVCAYNLDVVGFNYLMNMTPSQYVAKNSLIRKNLLDLSNPIYATSLNLISTILDQIDVRDSSSKFGMSARGVAGEHYYSKMFDPRNVIKLEILGDLPQNTSVSDVGIFYGPVPDVTEVTRQTIPMVITNVDNTTYEFDFEIISVPSSYVIGVDTTGDPILDLKLQALQCNPTFPCEPIDGCNDNCAPSYNFCFIQPDKFCPLQTRCECSV